MRPFRDHLTETAREKDILHQNGDYWVKKTPKGYVVFKDGVTHATSEPTAYSDLSIAIARCDYQAKRAAKGVHEANETTPSMNVYHSEPEKKELDAIDAKYDSDNDGEVDTSKDDKEPVDEGFVYSAAKAKEPRQCTCGKAIAAGDPYTLKLGIGSDTGKRERLCKECGAKEKKNAASRGRYDAMKSVGMTRTRSGQWESLKRFGEFVIENAKGVTYHTCPECEGNFKSTDMKDGKIPPHSPRSADGTRKPCEGAGQKPLDESVITEENRYEVRATRMKDGLVWHERKFVVMADTLWDARQIAEAMAVGYIIRNVVQM